MLVGQWYDRHTSPWVDVDSPDSIIWILLMFYFLLGIIDRQDYHICMCIYSSVVFYILYVYISFTGIYYILSYLLLRQQH
jgi:hypothetical protein